MEAARIIVQWIVGLGILNVWLLRPKKATAYRGGDAGNLKEEFAAYGLPAWFMYVVGACKIAAALMLMTGTWVSSLVQPGAIGMAILMSGAVLMHLKVKDTFKKTSASIAMLIMAVFIAITAS
ncbi:MAG: DoxX family protein [Pontiella sp.]|nr:DoxX family protein [Pontiella sp.]